MFWLLLNSLLFLFLWSAGAAVTNRTIDDTTGDSVTGNRPIYLPATPGVWEDATCKGCAIQPEKNRAFKGTWNAATYNPDLGSMSIELSFKGEHHRFLIISLPQEPDPIYLLTFV